MSSNLKYSIRCFQVRNNKRTAILAITYDKTKKESDKTKKNTKLFVVYRPNTGQQVLINLISNYIKIRCRLGSRHPNCSDTQTPLCDSLSEHILSKLFGYQGPCFFAYRDPWDPKVNKNGIKVYVQLSLVRSKSLDKFCSDIESAQVGQKQYVQIPRPQCNVTFSPMFKYTL